MKAMIHKLSKAQKSVIASVLALVMVFGVFAFIAPIEAQAISVDATDTGFYNIVYGTNGETTFDAGTQIRIINHTRAGKSKSEALYQLGETNEWTPTTDDYIVWEGKGENTFYGVYPYNAEYNSFTIPTDQSGGVQDADWMTDDYVGAKTADTGVDLHFEHRLAKVTVNITKWNSEFDGADKIITVPKIYTKGTAVTATYENGGATITATGDITGIDPLVDGTSFTAIVAPVKYNANDQFMTLTVDGQELNVLADISTLTDEGLLPGKHYTFNLTVGKEAVTIESVTVNGWTEVPLDGGVAEEAPNIANTVVELVGGKSFTHTGHPIEPDVIVTAADGSVLMKDTDYTVSYIDNVKRGTATAILTGKGKWFGEVRIEFTIKNIW